MKQIVAMIAAGLLAVGGVGAGVYGAVQSSQANKSVADMEVQQSSLLEELESLQAASEETAEVEETATTEASATAADGENTATKTTTKEATRANTTTTTESATSTTAETTAETTASQGEPPQKKEYSGDSSGGFDTVPG